LAFGSSKLVTTSRDPHPVRDTGDLVPASGQRHGPGDIAGLGIELQHRAVVAGTGVAEEPGATPADGRPVATGHVDPRDVAGGGVDARQIVRGAVARAHLDPRGAVTDDERLRRPIEPVPDDLARGGSADRPLAPLPDATEGVEDRPQHEH
jgi:hypothetical protein